MLVDEFDEDFGHLALAFRPGEGVLGARDSEVTDEVASVVSDANADGVQVLDVLLVVDRVAALPDRCEFFEQGRPVGDRPVRLRRQVHRSTIAATR
jgi:hypothetical protein